MVLQQMRVKEDRLHLSHRMEVNRNVRFPRIPVIVN